ncbi:hypothetical protein [Luethyella okanaganae]|uniref:Uncharacterized protein n=1 Tax=Luethyella okanaganae TaxID=69372 RepID=A0ABW1VIL3_9MICO
MADWNEIADGVFHARYEPLEVDFSIACSFWSLPRALGAVGAASTV